MNRRRMMMGQSGGSSPTTYVPLQYVECTGSQYIVTPIYANQNTTIKIAFCLNGFGGTRGTGVNPILGRATDSSYMPPYGVWMNPCDASDPNEWGDAMFTPHVSFGRASDLGYWAWYESPSTDWANWYEWEVSKDKNNLYYNGSLFKSAGFTSGTVGTFTHSQPLWIGAAYGYPYGNSTSYYTGLIGEITINSYHFVPALYNNVAGFYETTNDVFYSSATATPFVAGPAI